MYKCNIFEHDWEDILKSCQFYKVLTDRKNNINFVFRRLSIYFPVVVKYVHDLIDRPFALIAL